MMGAYYATTTPSHCDRRARRILAQRARRLTPAPGRPRASSSLGSTSKAVETLASQSIVGLVCCASTAKSCEREVPARSARIVSATPRLFARERMFRATSLRASLGDKAETIVALWHRRLRYTGFVACAIDHAALVANPQRFDAPPYEPGRGAWRFHRRGARDKQRPLLRIDARHGWQAGGRGMRVAGLAKPGVD